MNKNFFPAGSFTAEQAGVACGVSVNAPVRAPGKVHGDMRGCVCCAASGDMPGSASGHILTDAPPHVSTSAPAAGWPVWPGLVRLKWLRCSLACTAAVNVLFSPAPASAASGESFSSVIKDPEKLLSFLATTGGRSLLVFLFFLCIVLILRYLLGPGGKLRDPQWDKLNNREREHTRIERNIKIFGSRLEELAPELEEEIEKFKAYAAEFLNGEAGHDAMYLLKQEHSLNVLGHALSIAAQEEEFLPESWRQYKPEQGRAVSAGPGERLPAAQPIAEPDRILLLSALYHDIGRFEQLRRFNTFRDADSVNHAELGASLLEELVAAETRDNGEPGGPGPRFMAAEPEENRALVRLVVLAHNRFALPEDMPAQLTAISHAVRDADKLDILRVMAAELAPGHTPDPTVALDMEDEPEKYTPSVLDAALAKEQVKYSEMRYVNDFRLLLCSWLDNMVFPSSRRILAKNGHLEGIMNGLPDTPGTRQLIDRLKAELVDCR